MKKTEAAEIVANYITVTARREYAETGRPVHVDKNMIEETVSELAGQHRDGKVSTLTEAASLFPHWTTVRNAGRRG